jgi:hypothetical protein
MCVCMCACVRVCVCVCVYKQGFIDLEIVQGQCVYKMEFSSA